MKVLQKYPKQMKKKRRLKKKRGMFENFEAVIEVVNYSQWKSQIEDGI